MISGGKGLSGKRGKGSKSEKISGGGKALRSQGKGLSGERGKNLNNERGQRILGRKREKI